MVSADWGALGSAWGDVQGMLKVQGDQLDFAYLAKWANELDLTGIHVSAFEDAGLAPDSV